MKDPSKINWAQIKKELDDDRQKRNFKPSTTGTGKELPTVSVNAQKEPLSMPVYKEITQKYVDEKGVPFVSAPEDLPKLYQYGDRTNNPEMLKDYQRAVDEMRGAFGDDKTYSMLNIPNKPLDAKDTKQSDYASNMQNIGNALENSSLVNPVGAMVRGGAEGIKKGIETIGKTLSTPPEGFTKEQMIGNKGIGLTAGLTETALGIVSAVTPGIMAITEGTQLISEFGGKDVVEAVMTPVTKFTNPQTDTEKNLAMLGDLAANALLMKGIHKGVKTFKGEAPVEAPKEVTPEVPKVEAPKVDYLGEYESVNKQMAILDNKVKMNSNLLKEAKGSQRKKLSKEIESAQNEKVLLDLRQSELRQQLQEQGVLKTVDPVKDNTAEFKGGTSPVKVIGEEVKPSEIITNNAPSKVELSLNEIGKIVSDYDGKLREAEVSGDSALYDQLVKERQPWLDKLPKQELENKPLRAVEEPVKQTVQEVPALSKDELKSAISDYDTKLKQAEQSGDEALFNQLSEERKPLVDRLQATQRLEVLDNKIQLKNNLAKLSKDPAVKKALKQEVRDLTKEKTKLESQYKPKETPAEPVKAVETAEPSSPKSPEAIRATQNIIKTYDEKLRQAESMGDEAEYNKLSQERQFWIDKLGDKVEEPKAIAEDNQPVQTPTDIKGENNAVEERPLTDNNIQEYQNNDAGRNEAETGGSSSIVKSGQEEVRPKVNEGGDTSFEFGENAKKDTPAIPETIERDWSTSESQKYIRDNESRINEAETLTPIMQDTYAIPGENANQEYKAILAPSAKEKGKWQITFFSLVDGSPFSDRVFNTKEEALKDFKSEIPRRPDIISSLFDKPIREGKVKAETIYELQRRPPSIGTHPIKGFLRYEEAGKKFGHVIYDRMLSNKELQDYELKPVGKNIVKVESAPKDFELTSGEKEIAPKPKSEFGEQMSLGGETIKTQMPDKPLYEGKADKSGETPLFQQEAEVKGQEKMFDTKTEALTENRIISDEAYEKAKANIIRKSSQLNAGVDPTLLKDYTVAGAYHLENIVRSGIKKNQQLAVWVKKMTDQYGEDIKPQLLSIWNDINKNTPELSAVAGNSFNFTAKTTLNEQDYNKYINFRKEQESFSGHLKDIADKIKDNGESGNSVLSKGFASKDRIVERISPKLFRKLEEYEQKMNFLIMNRMKSLEGFVKGVQKFSKEDKYRLELAMFNSDGKMLTELFKKYNMEGEHAQLRQTLNELAETSGIKPGEFYFPRAIKNYAEFLKQFQDLQNRNIFDKLIEDHERKFGKMTDEQKFHLIDNTLRGYNKGITLSKIGNEKARVIRILDSNLAQNYYDPFTSLSKYIFEMTEMQEARKFFGKIADGNSKSIGELTLEMIKNEKLDYNNANKLVEVLNARFQPKRSPKFITSVKKVIYIEKLGQVTSALTQLKDLSTSLYRNGALATTKALYEVITNKKAVGVEDIGIMQDKIAQELSDPSKLNAILDNTMKYAGFTKLDVLGKETFINGYMKRFKGEALKDSKILHERLDKLFDANEKAQVIEDLKAGNKSDNVKLLLFSELSRTQPISKSALPVGYDTSPIGRILYTFRTFAIRRLNFWMDETVREFKTNKPQAIKNTLRLATYAGLMGASVDAVTNILLGRKMSKEDIESTLLYNTLDVLTVNKYLISQFGQRQFSDAMSSLLKVPVPLVDNVYADIRNLAKTGKFKGHVLKSVPIGGRILYDRLNKK